MASLAELCQGLGEGGRAPWRGRAAARAVRRRATCVSPEGIFGGPVTRYLALCAAARADWDVAASTWRPRGRRRSGSRSARRSRCSTSTRPRSSPGAPGPGDAEAARALLVRARGALAAIGVPVMGGGSSGVEEMVGATGAGAASRVPAGDRSRRGRAADGLHREPAPRGRRVARRVRGPHLLRQGREGPAPPRAAPRQPGRRVPRGRPRRRAPRAPRPRAVARASPGDADVEVRRRGRRRRRALDPQAKREYRDRASRTCARRSRRPRTSTTPSAPPGRARRWSSSPRELSGAVGLGGRDRKAASNAERARVNVTRAVRRRHPPHRRARTRASAASSRRTVRTGTSAATSPIRGTRDLAGRWRSDAMAGEVESFDVGRRRLGFGGSVTARRLAEAGRSVLLLERGRP